MGAVPKRKVSKARRDKRRAHDALSLYPVSYTHLPGQPPAARNMPAVAAISSRKTMRSLNSTVSMCKVLRQPVAAAWVSNERSVAFDNDIATPT